MLELLDNPVVRIVIGVVVLAVLVQLARKLFSRPQKSATVSAISPNRRRVSSVNIVSGPARL